MSPALGVCKGPPVGHHGSPFPCVYKGAGSWSCEQAETTLLVAKWEEENLPQGEARQGEIQVQAAPSPYLLGAPQPQKHTVWACVRKAKVRQYGLSLAETQSCTWACDCRERGSPAPAQPKDPGGDFLLTPQERTSAPPARQTAPDLGWALMLWPWEKERPRDPLKRGGGCSAQNSGVGGPKDLGRRLAGSLYES